MHGLSSLGESKLYYTVLLCCINEAYFWNHIAMVHPSFSLWACRSSCATDHWRTGEGSWYGVRDGEQYELHADTAIDDEIYASVVRASCGLGDKRKRGRRELGQHHETGWSECLGIHRQSSPPGCSSSVRPSIFTSTCEHRRASTDKTILF